MHSKSYNPESLYPRLVIDRQRCMNNIRRMQQRAAGFGLALRPHFKTHQSALVGGWFRETGHDRIAVSSVGMAQYFADAGWNDIMIAFPVHPGEASLLNKLARKLNLGICLSSPAFVTPVISGIEASVEAYLKVDVGSQRTGFDASKPGIVIEAVQKIHKNPLIRFRGFIAHAGHTYHRCNAGEINQIHARGMECLTALRSALGPGFADLTISWGDTPSCSLAGQTYGENEWRPGNYVFYDLTQAAIGSCTIEDIAVCVAAPLVALHPERGEAVLHAGAVHLSAEAAQDEQGRRHFGRVVYLDEKKGWSLPVEEIFVRRISQEHGVIQAGKAWLRERKAGELLGVLPVHSCLTVDLLRHDQPLIVPPV